MSQTNLVSEEITIPLIQRRSLREKLHLLKNESVLIAKIFFPLVLTSGLFYLRSLFSMHFLSGIGSTTLAAGCSLALATANITAYSLFSGLTGGAETICSQAIGAKRYNLFRATIRRGMILLIFTSLPVFFVWIKIETILTALQQDKTLVPIAHTFLLYSIPGLVAQSVLNPLRAYLRTQSKTVPLSICTLVVTVLHFLILFLVVSHLGFEVEGVALSGVVSDFNLVACLYIYIRFLKEKIGSDDEEEEEEEEDSHEDSVREWKKLCWLAIPSCAMVCLEWWCYEIMILICGSIKTPEVDVASMGFIIQLTSLVYVFPHSLSSAVSTRVGNELGSNRPHGARRAAIVGIGLSILLGIMSFTFVVSVRNIWAACFTYDEHVIELTSTVLPIVGLCELGNCPQTTVCGILKGSARPLTGALINAAAFYFVGLPVALVLVFRFGFGLMGLWLGMLAAQISCVVGVMVAMYRTNWELEAERARKLTSVNVNDAEAERLISRVES